MKKREFISDIQWREKNMNKQIPENIRKCSVSYEDELIKDLQDPSEATAYLEGSIEAYQEDGDLGAFKLALKHLAQAAGGIKKLAEKTALNRQALYKLLSSESSPRLDTLTSILNALGYRLSIVCEPQTKYATKSLKKRKSANKKS